MGGHFYVSDWGKKAYAEGLAKGRAEAQVEIRPEALAEGRTQGLALGRIEGERERILRVLKLRKLELMDEDRERIVSCHDLVLLRAWHDRAITARTASEIF